MKRHPLACGHPDHEGDRLITDHRDAFNLSVDAMRADEKQRRFRISAGVLGNHEVPATVCMSCLGLVEQYLRPKIQGQRGLF